MRVHKGHVVNGSEPIRYRGAVTSANREGSQQRRETVTHYARLHDVRVDVDGIEPARHAHQLRYGRGKNHRNSGWVAKPRWSMGERTRVCSLLLLLLLPMNW